MAKVFGVSNSSPETVIETLIRRKVVKSNSDIAVHPVGTKLGVERVKAKAIFLLTIADLTHNMKTLCLSSYKDMPVFVFAAPMKLAEIRGVFPLDYEPDPSLPGFGFILKPLSLRALKTSHESRLKRRDGKYLANLLTHVQEGSLLNTLMTAIYSVPSAAQTITRVTICRWLLNGKKESELSPALQKLQKEYPLTDNARKKLEGIVLSEVGKKYFDALHQYAKAKSDGNAKVDSIAKSTGCSAYEMRYCIHVVEDAESSTLYTSSFEKAKNHRR